MIGTVSDSQEELLSSIATLYNQGQRFHVDLTYGNGGFWRKAPLLSPPINADLTMPDPREGSIVLSKKAGEDTRCRVLGQNLVCDVRALPFAPLSVQSIVFDPPFLHATGEHSIMGNRFGGYKSQAALHQLYAEATAQIGRSLVHGGLLVWKCQDVVESGRQVWTHIKIHDIVCAGDSSFQALDFFILTKPSRIVGWNHHQQIHARKHHSYFWVFRKH